MPYIYPCTLAYRIQDISHLSSALADAQIDTPIEIEIPLKTPYRIKQEVRLNKFGIAEKPSTQLLTWQLFWTLASA
jgi:hypothetical protein